MNDPVFHPRDSRVWKWALAQIKEKPGSPIRGFGICGESQFSDLTLALSSTGEGTILLVSVLTLPRGSQRGQD